MPGKVLLVVTNDGRELGPEGKKTGWYLPEAAQPFHVLQSHGYQCYFLSPKGGKAPMDVGSFEEFQKEEICQEFLKNDLSKLDSTLAPSDVNAKDYVGLFYVGGYGPMFDLPDNTEIANLARDIYENGGVLGAVCHGTVGFLSIKLSSGELLVKGQTLTSFTDSEDSTVKMDTHVPFPLETRLRESGAKFESVENFGVNVVVCGRLVTGQNPASAIECAKKMAEVLKQEGK